MAVLMVLFCGQAYACSVCFGSSEFLFTKSLNAGVIFLVGIIGVVLSSIAYTAFVWARRAKHLSDASQDNTLL